MNQRAFVAAVAALAGAASAQVNGSYSAPYGPALSVQQNSTGFGDASGGNIQDANGSEVDAAYAYSDGANVHLLFTGNLESNFNKLAIFIDNGSALGQNQITGGNGLPAPYTGFSFDTGFRATQFISVTCGHPGGGAFQMFVDGADLTNGMGGFIGQNDGQSGGVLGGGNNFFNMLVALDNSNGAGVTGASGTGALTATTGVELQIPLASLGLAAADFRVCAFINGQNHDYASNQFLGSLPFGQGNLGGDGAGNFTGSVGGIDLNSTAYAAGLQYFTVPAPGALALLASGGLVAGRRRRA
jgi:hypothetical protein